jgi:hypothetical protein
MRREKRSRITAPSLPQGANFGRCPAARFCVVVAGGGCALTVRTSEVRRAPGFKSTKQAAELRFRTLLTDGAQEEVRFEWVAVG